MTTDSISISVTLGSGLESTVNPPVPVTITYVLDGNTVTRNIGPAYNASVNIDFDTGSTVTLQAPRTATDGSIQSSPPDLLTYRFRSWKPTALDRVFSQTWTGIPTDGLELTAEYTLESSFLTRSPSRRATKLQAKTDEEVAQIRTTALKPLQVKNQAITSYEQTHMETKLGTVLCRLGIVGNDQHHYRNFAQELYGLKRTFTDLTLQNEASLRAQKWLARGLVPSILVKTAQLQGLDIDLGKIDVVFQGTCIDGQVEIDNLDGTSYVTALTGLPQTLSLQAGKPLRIVGQCHTVPTMILLWHLIPDVGQPVGLIDCEDSDVNADYSSYPELLPTQVFDDVGPFFYELM